MAATIVYQIKGLAFLSTRLKALGSGGFASILEARVTEAGEVLVSEMQEQLSKGPSDLQSYRESGKRIEYERLPVNTTKHLRIVTGRLLQAVDSEVSAIPGGFQARVGPQRVVYGPIHEYGGQAGRGRSVTIKPRPYAGPAEEKARDEITAILLSAFDRIK